MSTSNQPNERLIVALDVSTRREALHLVRALRPAGVMFKVGLELFLAEGPAIVRAIAAEGGRVFLDLKLLDIPATVSRALRVIAGQGAHIVFTTIHPPRGAGAGAALGLAGLAPLRVLAVTLLTSMDEADLSPPAGSGGVEAHVVAVTGEALEAGCAGVVASGAEVGAIRRRFGAAPVVVTPGIRPEWARVAGDDQKRAVTPREAILAGADHLVVGRPVRDAAQGPLAAVERILVEIDEALREKKGR